VLLESIKELLKLKARIRKVDLIVEMDPAISREFYTDPTRLKQILLNLSGNALKFTFSGYIKITGELVPHPKGGRKLVKFTIEDTGMGIEKANIGKLFKLFAKLDSTKSENKSGAGLGLMISSNLVRRLNFEGGGGIDVISEKGKGSKFFFTIENKQVANPQAIQIIKVSKKVDNLRVFTPMRKRRQELKLWKPVEFCECPKILIVDDNEFNIYSLQLLLSIMGPKSDFANNGQVAIDMIAER